MRALLSAPVLAVKFTKGVEAERGDYRRFERKDRSDRRQGRVRPTGARMSARSVIKPTSVNRTASARYKTWQCATDEVAGQVVADTETEGSGQ
jgi:hypothetical protein